MPSVSNIVFTDICLNGFLSVNSDWDGKLKECAISQRDGRYFLLIKISGDVEWNLDVQKSLAALNYSKWEPETKIDAIVDFTIRVGSVPSWMVPYTTAPKGCLQWIFATLKLKDSRVNYLGFIRDLQPMLSASQCKELDHAEALALWEKRRTPIKSEVKALNIGLPKFQNFSLPDLERLKDDCTWLTDSHVTLCLLDSYQKHSKANTWGDLKITLLDTVFWTQMSADPDAYHKKYRAKVNLVGYDFVVMPMFGHDHWWLGIIEKPGEFMEGRTVFHILDSLPGLAQGNQEASQLQNILLKHFEGAVFEEGRITINYAQVPRQPNTYACGCFLIYFAQTFFSDPEWTMTVIKKSFPSLVDRLAGWGLETNNLSFVRREMRGLLFEYMKQGHATVEYKKK